MYNFLSEELIHALHTDQLELYGGVHGLRDANLLDSALNVPKAQFEGQSLYTSIFHVAAAYGFHISENQPFYKGNKRTAGMAMLVFLELNGFESTATSKDYYDVILAVANKEMNKEQLANWLEKSVVRIA